MVTSSLVFNSCLDEIELEVPRGQSDAIVVQGKLTVGEESQVSVTVNRIFTFDGTSTTLRVKFVEIYNEKEERVELDFVEEGVYFKTINEDDPMTIELGLLYKIKLELFDGRIIESEVEPLKSLVAQNELELSIEEKPIVNVFEDEIIDRERIVINLLSEFENNSDNPQRYRWFVNVTQKVDDFPQNYGVQNRTSKSCYIRSTFPVEEQVLFNGFDSDKIGSVSFETEVFDGRVNDGRYLDTVYFNVIQESLTEGAYDYYNSIGQTLELSGSMFDPAAGKIKSNLINVTNPDEEVFGYFYASQQVQSNIRLIPEIFGNIPRSLCLGASSQSPLTESQCGFTPCCDCNGRRNDIPQKPKYWK